MKFWSKWCLSLMVVAGMAVSPLLANAAGETDSGAGASGVQVSNSAEVASRLGVLLGDGQGVNEAYLAKSTTRVQGVILTLRLLGKEKEALAYTGTDSFTDASAVGKNIQPVLAYLKKHPELGWSGTGGGKFSPNAAITAQQVYKVMLESLAYRTGTDFQYADSLPFAASIGLSRAAAASPFTNKDLATALIETLQMNPKGGNETLLSSLVKMQVVSSDKADLLAGDRIDMHKTADGSVYFTDGKGMALYLFAKDMADLNSCSGQCLANWPVFKADRLLLADGLDGKDFGSFVRTDGSKQITYKGWPLYNWVKDVKPGDVSGEGVGGVWYLIKNPFYTVALGNDPNLKTNYLADAKGMSLYYFDKDPKGISVCTDQCLVNWPAFHADSIVVPSGLKAGDFGEIIRPDGSKQTTYKGYPLYYWIKDTKRGDITGQNVNKVWFLVDPSKFTGTTAEQSVTERITIEMKNYAFSQQEVTIKAGGVVTFMNMDNDNHNAVSADGKTFKIPLIGKGQSVSVKLDTPGTYEYYCEPHQEHMKGKIIVQ